MQTDELVEFLKESFTKVLNARGDLNRKELIRQVLAKVQNDVDDMILDSFQAGQYNTLESLW